jgi:hypothetical protein
MGMQLPTRAVNPEVARVKRKLGISPRSELETSLAAIRRTRQLTRPANAGPNLG